MVEIETAKAAVELPSPFAGRVHALLVEPGVTVEVGTPIITVDTDPGAGDLPDSRRRPHHRTRRRPGERVDRWRGFGPTTWRRREDRRGDRRRPDRHAGRLCLRGRRPPLGDRDAGDGRPARPPRLLRRSTPPSTLHRRPPRSLPTMHRWPPRRCASSPRTSASTWRSVTATRQDGVISRADVENAAAAKGSAAAVRPGPAYDPATREQRIPVKGIRKATAAAMVASAFTAPHVTEFLTVDVTPMMELRDRLRAASGVRRLKLDPAGLRRPRGLPGGPPDTGDQRGLRGRPGARFRRDRREAVREPRHRRGHPARADRAGDPGRRSLDLAGLAAALQDLTATARDGHTTLAQMTGGTFTITNVGVFGVDTGTPIINPGEAAILALGSIKDAPWVVDGAAGGPQGVPAGAVLRPPGRGRAAGLAVPGRRRCAARRPGPGDRLLTLDRPTPEFRSALELRPVQHPQP